MDKEIEAKKICNITDSVTKIRYKIVYKKTPNRYEIYTQFKDEKGVLRRNRILFKEAIAVESDLEKTIAYVNDFLVANHINIYEDKNYVFNDRSHRRKKMVKPLPDDCSEDERINHAHSMDIEDLRLIAEMCSNHKEVVIEKSKGRYRNTYIAEYSKRRAGGICQLCGEKAPFNDKNGEPYLESHHIVWLSKGGEDSIDNVAALCPNCHRRMHIIDDERDVNYLLTLITKDKQE